MPKHNDIDDDSSYDEDQFRDEPDAEYDNRPIKQEGDEEDDDQENGRYMDNPDADPEQPARRQFKYSTAQQHESSRCRKYCMIFLLFMLFFLICIGLSMLFNWLFFDSGPTDNAPSFAERNASETFPNDKLFLDQVCSIGTFDADEGSRCREACEPQFFTCCDPFGEFNDIVISDGSNSTNSTLDTGPESIDGSFFETNVTDPNAENDPNFYTDDAVLLNCTFDQEVRGCMSYSKCQALGGLIDPAPGTLPILCAADALVKDPDSCAAACRRARCCWAEPGDNCLARNFDICMDYAPCQNLRSTEDFIVETAPDDLDRACLWELPECFETCEKAKCCGDPESTCFRNNFMACLTYAPCTNVTGTPVNITVTPMYSNVAEPPVELKSACNADNEPILQEVDKTCNEYCEESACCRDTDQSKNCFHLDPLGCIQWEHQCQMLALDNL